MRWQNSSVTIFVALNTKRSYAAYTHNKLLNNYKYAVGIKTGYTQKAGPCLIARAKNRQQRHFSGDAQLRTPLE